MVTAEMEDYINKIQFKEHLDLLREELVIAILACQIYTNILIDNHERLNAINSLHVFFTTAARSCRATVFLALSNIFDRNSQSVNIWKILEAAKQAPQDWDFDLTAKDFDEMYSKLALHQRAIDGIKKVRNKSIAHIEVTDVQSSTLGELEEVLALAEYIIEKMYYTCFAQENLYAGVKSDAREQTKEIIDLVMADRDIKAQ